jgi:drug/metabolite transporter (DMT)-like permease
MVVTTLMWSTAGVVTRHLESAQTFEITFWRAFFTFVALLVILPVWQGRGFATRMLRSGPVLWASGACWAVMFTAFMVALTLTSVANVLVTMAAGPLLTALMARLTIGHRLPRRTWAAIVLGGVGIAWIFGSKWAAGQVAGTVVALCVPVAAAINWTLVHRNRHQEQQIDLVPAVFLGALLSALVTLPLAWPMRASAHDLLLLAGLGVGQLAVPCVLSVLCARVLSAPEVSLLGLLEVLFGILLAWLGADEVPSAQVLWGGSLVVGALVLNEGLAWRERRGMSRANSLTVA